MSDWRRISSSSARLLSHVDRIHEIRNRKKIRPITVEIAPTDKCNLNCSWCSVRDREGKSLTWDQCKQVIDTYYKLGVKSIEITGGGEPLLYPYIEDLVDYAHDSVGHVGLITNGLLLNKMEDLEDFTSKLDWMRISLSGPLHKYREINPDKLWTYVGCSYLVDRHIPKAHFQEFYTERMAEPLSITKHLHGQYLRVVPDCNLVREINALRSKRSYFEKVDPLITAQAKDYYVPSSCYWRYIKPFVNSDGWVYQCSTCALFERKFPMGWRAARVEFIDDIYEGPITSFDNSKCTLCFFNYQNDIIADLLKEVMHREFV